MNTGFNNDNLIRSRIVQLRDQFRLTTAIETGTYEGHTSEALCQIFDCVHSIEKNPTILNDTMRRLMSNPPNLTFWLGDSPQVLRHLCPLFQESVLFYLDAHWGDSPLLQELDALKAARFPPIIAIHDFKVPGKDFGYDSYNGQDYEWDWIKKSIISLYHHHKVNFRTEYPTEVEGSRRGIIYIYPSTDPFPKLHPDIL